MLWDLIMIIIPNDGQFKHDITEWNHYGIIYNGKILSVVINGKIDTQIQRKYQIAVTQNQK